jgi:hypothetical protein
VGYIAHALNVSNPKPAVLAAIAMATLLVSGCGGGSSSSGTTGGSQVGASPDSESQPAAPVTTATPAQTQTVTTATTAAPPTTQSAVATANAICARRNRELTAAPEVGADMPALLAASRKRAAIEERSLGELEKLKPPADIAKRYNDLLVLYKQALLKVVKVGEHANAGDAAGAARAREQAGVKPLRLLVLTAHTGLRDCSGLG